MGASTMLQSLRSRRRAANRYSPEGVVTLDPAREGAQSAAFLERNGHLWGARPDVTMRAGLVTGEAMEAIREAGVTGPMRLTASFDEFNMRCRLRYAGKALILDKDAVLDPMTLDQDDDALDARDAQGVRRPHRPPGRPRPREAERGKADLTLSFDH
jgi:hypothetical protein